MVSLALDGQAIPWCTKLQLSEIKMGPVILHAVISFGQS